jgi:U6 snRNA-associated Sm-like protein LSm7
MSTDNQNQTKKGGPPKKESILELAKLMDATVRVKCMGGRELQGSLKGYDELVNLVLDDCYEFIRGKAIFAQQLVPIALLAWLLH